MLCSECGFVGADARPNWLEQSRGRKAGQEPQKRGGS
jgi:hypothetical protein